MKGQLSIKDRLSFLHLLESFNRDTNSQNMATHTHTHTFNVVFQGMVTPMAHKGYGGEEIPCSMKAMGLEKLYPLYSSKKREVLSV